MQDVRVSDLVIDETDRAILHLLQEDARYTITSIADAVGVSGNTVRNRIERLEEDGIITGYSVDLDYKKIGLDLHFVFDCSTRVGERERLAVDVLDIPGVIEVRELMTGQDNVRIESVGADTEDITRIAHALDSRGLAIEREALVRNDYSQPLTALKPTDAKHDG